MKVGITLPQFRDDAEPAFATARLAEDAGLDGVFVFDHLWPLGRPDRPALHGLTLLGGLAAETGRVSVGTLVARIGLLPDAVLVNALAAVHRLAGRRLIAGLGVGDRLSMAENLSFAVPFAPVSDRLESLAQVCADVRRQGMVAWIGGLSPAVHRLAASCRCPLNLWGVAPERVATVTDVEVTWGGQVRPADDLPALLTRLAEAGATWAVCAPVGDDWPAAVERIAAARDTLV